MLKFISRALLSIFIDKDARDSLDSAQEAKLARKKAFRAGAAGAGDAPAGGGRDDLIREALTIQRNKAHILDGMDDEVRERLSAMALQALAGQDPGTSGSRG